MSWLKLETFSSSDNSNVNDNDEVGPSPRVGCSLVSLESGLFLFGGASHEEGYWNDLWHFAAKSFTWTRLVPSIKNSSFNNDHDNVGGVTSTPGGLVAATSDDDRVVQPSPRYDHLALPIDENSFCLFGGCGEIKGQMKLFNDLWIYHSKQNCWELVDFQGNNGDVIPCARTIQTGVFWKQSSDDDDGESSFNLVLFGGGGGNENKPVDDSKLWIFNLSTRKWTSFITGDDEEGSLRPANRSGHRMELIAPNQVLLFGGLNEDGDSLNDIWLLNLITKQWSQVSTPDTITPRIGHVMTILNESENETDAASVLIQGGLNINLKSGRAEILSETGILKLHFSDRVSAEYYSLVDKSIDDYDDDHDDLKRVDHALCKLSCNDASPAIYLFGGMNSEGVYNRLFKFQDD